MIKTTQEQQNKRFYDIKPKVQNKEWENRMLFASVMLVAGLLLALTQ